MMGDVTAHRRSLETTNGGNVFADCSCGWSGGVFPSRRIAGEAWTAHRDGAKGPEHIRPVLLIGGPITGQEV